jgi:hypothetical protein
MGGIVSRIRDRFERYDSEKGMGGREDSESEMGE